MKCQRHGRRRRPAPAPPPAQSFFLLGPRGSGKSTWVRHELRGALRIDLLGEARYHAFLARASLFADELRALPPRSVVVVDEIQRLPQLLNEVHRFIEERRFPFVPAELGAAFDLDTALATGTLPVICRAPSPREALVAHVQLYLREEIQAEALVRNLPGFARFLPVAALFHGQTLNVASLAGDAEVSRTTVAGYVEIIEDTLLAFRLPAHEGRMRVRERRPPKLSWLAGRPGGAPWPPGHRRPRGLPAADPDLPGRAAPGHRGPHRGVAGPALPRRARDRPSLALSVPVRTSCGCPAGASPAPG